MGLVFILRYIGQAGVISLFSIKIIDKREYGAWDKCIVTESWTFRDSDDPFYGRKSTDPSADALARLLRLKHKITKLLLDQSLSTIATNLEKTTYDLLSIHDVKP